MMHTNGETSTPARSWNGGRLAGVVTASLFLVLCSSDARAQRRPKVHDESIDVRFLVDRSAPRTVAFEVVNAEALGLRVDRWSFGDGATSEAERPFHTYGTTGVYDVQVRLRQNGKRTTMATRTVDLEALPRIEIVARGRTLPETPRQFWFEAVASLADGTPVDPAAIEWSFPDGSGAAGPRVEHTFASDGEKTVTAFLRSPTGLVLSDSMLVEVGDEIYHGFEGGGADAMGGGATTTTDPARVQTGESALVVSLGTTTFSVESVPSPLLEAAGLLVVSEEAHLSVGLLADATLRVDFSRLQNVIVESVTSGRLELSSAEQDRVLELVKSFEEGAPQPLEIAAGAWRCVLFDVFEPAGGGLAEWTLRIDGNVVLDVEGVSLLSDAAILNKLLPLLLASDVFDIGGGEWLALDDVWVATVPIECP